METQPWGSQTEGIEHSSTSSPTSRVATREILDKIEEVESTLLVEDPKPTKEGNQDTLDATVVTSMEKVKEAKASPTTDDEDPGCKAKDVSNEPQSSKNTSKDPQPTVKRLIVPPGHDVPIKQHMTDIFAKSPPTALPPQDGGAPADRRASRTTLDVKASIWMSQQELQKTKKCQLEPTNNAVNAEPKDIPVKPSSWGTTQYISPDMQCPPKQRGRKPKGDKVADENNKDSKGATAKAKMQRSKAKSRKSKTAAKASSSSAKAPSARMREYLKEQKEKRLKAEEENCKEGNNEGEEEEPLPHENLEATHGDDDADHGKEPSKGHKRKKGTKKTQVDDVDKGSKNKKSSKKPQQKKDCSQKEAKKEAKKQPAKNRRKVAAAKEQDLPPAALGKVAAAKEQDLPPAVLGKAEERKKRYSRKSAAYHRAYKSTKGSVEEKKAAGKKANCLQLCFAIVCNVMQLCLTHIQFTSPIATYMPGPYLRHTLRQTDFLISKIAVSWIPDMLG